MSGSGSLRHGLFGLLMVPMVSLIAPGCDSTEPASPTARVATRKSPEPTWAEQLLAVRSGDSRQLIVRDGRIAPAELEELGDHCTLLEVLELDHVDTGPDGLSVVGRLPNLKRIKLGCRIDDDDVAELVRAERLIAVNLPEATFTDRGLQMLASLSDLESLRFRSPHVTDAGIEYIAEMPALRFLHLIEVPVTDAGLEHLSGLVQLESFYLDGGRCTDAGLRTLLSALPELHFHRNQLHLPGDPRADDHAESDAVGVEVR